MFFGKKDKGPELPEPFSAESAFGSAYTEQPQQRAQAMPALKMDEIKKAVTSPAQAPQFTMQAQQAQPQPAKTIAPAQPPAAPPITPQRAPPPSTLQPPRMQPIPPPPAMQPAPQAQNTQAATSFPKAFAPPAPKAFTPPAAQPNFPPRALTPPAPQTNPTGIRAPPQFTPQAQPQSAPPAPQGIPPKAFTPPQSPPNAFPQLKPPEMRAPPPPPTAIPAPRAPQNIPFAKPQDDSPFSPKNFEAGAARTARKTEAEEATDEIPEVEFIAGHAELPEMLPPPPPPHAEPEAARGDATPAEKRAKAEGEIDYSQPEMLRALVELVSKDSTVEIVETLRQSELSIAEIAEKTGIEENDIKDTLHRFLCLGLAKDHWYISGAGDHLRKYRLDRTRGNIEFDLLALKYALPIDELKAKSTRLVALITTAGRIPKSVLIKTLPVMDEEQLEQVIRYTERFKLPSIRDMLSVETKVAQDLKIPKQTDSRPSEKPPEVTDLYYEIESIQKSLGDLE